MSQTSNLSNTPTTVKVVFIKEDGTLCQPKQSPLKTFQRKLDALKENANAQPPRYNY